MSDGSVPRRWYRKYPRSRAAHPPSSVSFAFEFFHRRGRRGAPRRAENFVSARRFIPSSAIPAVSVISGLGNSGFPYKCGTPSAMKAGNRFSHPAAGRTDTFPAGRVFTTRPVAIPDGGTGAFGRQECGVTARSGHTTTPTSRGQTIRPQCRARNLPRTRH